jgi:hypothetical protein
VSSTAALRGSSARSTSRADLAAPTASTPRRPRCGWNRKTSSRTATAAKASSTSATRRDRRWTVEDWRITAGQEDSGESLDGRLARELPDSASPEGEGDGLGDVIGTDSELRDDEIGDERAGRFRDHDDLADSGGSSDDEPELVS